MCELIYYGMPTICNNCNSEVKLIVNNIVNHSGDTYSGKNGSYKLKIKAECECESKKPRATELDSIEFRGNPPESWV